MPFISSETEFKGLLNYARILISVVLCITEGKSLNLLFSFLLPLSLLSEMLIKQEKGTVIIFY